MLLAAALLLSCTEPAQDERSLDLAATVTQGESDPTGVLSGSRAVVDILTRSDTAGLGAYLHHDFRWVHHPPHFRSANALPRLAQDPHYVDRTIVELPLLEAPAPTRYAVLRSWQDAATVQGFAECVAHQDCATRPRVRLEWRRTDSGWKLIRLDAQGQPRRTP